jgi:FkbM family methyltransferase
MSIMTSPLVLRLRRYARAAGIANWLAGFRSGYEEAYSEQLRQAIRRDDVVWDVGANVGHYSTQISDLVGPSGKVFAFEPDTVTAERLRANCSGKQNIVVHPYGLSDTTHGAMMLAGNDAMRTTSRLVQGEGEAAESLSVQLIAGDEVIARGEADFPNIIKIDVEGHELNVLRGLSTILSDTRLRSVFVEVHFGVLDSMGRSGDPEQIESLLKANQFKVKWTDSSHLAARRISRV